MASSIAEAPFLRISATVDRLHYRPGDTVVCIVEVSLAIPQSAPASVAKFSAVLQELTVQATATEKVDPTWITLPTSSAQGGKTKGERLIFSSTAMKLLEHEAIKAHQVRRFACRVTLPDALPPSYLGTAVRYSYVITAHAQGPAGISPLVVRVPLRVWVPSSAAAYSLAHSTAPLPSSSPGTELQQGQGPVVEFNVGNNLPAVRVRWKELPVSEQEARAHQSGAAQSLEHETPISDGNSGPSSEDEPDAVLKLKRINVRSSYDGDPIYHSPPTVAKLAAMGILPGMGSVPEGSPTKLHWKDEDEAQASPLATIWGRTFNIRLGEHPLVRFSLSNPSAVYLLGDTVSGILDFSCSRKGAVVQCQQVTVTLETEEIIAPEHLHRSIQSGSIRKVHTEFQELCTDTLITNFIFTVPIDATAAFTSSLASFRWLLCFEFVALQQPPDEPEVRGLFGVRAAVKPKPQLERLHWSMPIAVLSPPPSGALPSRLRRKHSSGGGGAGWTSHVGDSFSKQENNGQQSFPVTA
eukprot:jgi/Chlat1/1571/Chrsp123S00081